jgi:paraquat-inducible protein A
MTDDVQATGEKRYSACPCCDTLHEQVLLEEGTSARCMRCGATMYRNRPASLQRASAFSLAALIAMVAVHAFPFLTMDAASMRRELTLTGTAEALIGSGMLALGGCVVLFTMVTPVVLAGGFLYVCLPLHFGAGVPGAKWVAKWIYRSEPWNMVEVFLLGVLVSLLKLAKVADVEFGVGFWAFAFVMLCLGGAVAGIDKEELWEKLEEVES